MSSQTSIIKKVLAGFVVAASLQATAFAKEVTTQTTTGVTSEEVGVSLVPFPRLHFCKTFPTFPGCPK